MCSTVHFTYRCGCADKAVFKCLHPHLHHLHPDQDQDHPEEQGGDPMEIAAPDDNQQQPLDGSPSPSETPLPVPSITITMATSLDEECQDCIANHHGAASTAELDEEEDTGSSDGSPLDDLPASSSSPLSVREEGEVLAVTAGAAETMLPPPPLATVQQQRRQAPQRPRFQRRGVERHGLREIPLNMV
ncbi:uncharacterized protein PG986_015062 [Apiospora aurea]|uniref:Uncharacterized protein n=1 Tax=Apiospora aurea TaxID=335848 RepID=A0ABR1PRZ1_9PEZI